MQFVCSAGSAHGARSQSSDVPESSGSFHSFPNRAGLTAAGAIGSCGCQSNPVMWGASWVPWWHTKRRSQERWQGTVEDNRGCSVQNHCREKVCITCLVLNPTRYNTFLSCCLLAAAWQPAVCAPLCLSGLKTDFHNWEALSDCSKMCYYW